MRSRLARLSSRSQALLASYPARTNVSLWRWRPLVSLPSPLRSSAPSQLVVCRGKPRWQRTTTLRLWPSTSVNSATPHHRMRLEGRLLLRPWQPLFVSRRHTATAARDGKRRRRSGRLSARLRPHTFCGLSLEVPLITNRSAPSGGLGVASSNLAAPTIQHTVLETFYRSDLQSGLQNHGIVG